MATNFHSTTLQEAETDMIEGSVRLYGNGALDERRSGSDGVGQEATRAREGTSLRGRVALSREVCMPKEPCTPCKEPSTKL
jgi:hypothetical protein